ncbi:MAG: SIS domain-containing protein [Oscillospiraceae bacterium]|nr:SIS domain-containing protein [Oscillospiraceae bacterium]
MEAINQFYNIVIEMLEKIATEQRENIERAATLVADAIESGNVFHVVGSGGHSNMTAIEMCHRAGNLIPCNSILDPGFSCEHGATRWCEKIPGYAPNVLRYYRVKPGDVLIQFNAYGINTATIDMVEECKHLGVTVVAVTSPSLSRSIPKDFAGRHPSKQNLCDLADIVIDDYCIFGEGVVEIDGYDYKVSPTSTISNVFIMDSINAKACEILATRGIAPPVWISGNIPGGTEINQAGMDKYFGKLRHL